MRRAIPSAVVAIMVGVALVPAFLGSQARVYGAGGAQAHTSPICVQVSGERASSKDDATYFLEWIDRLEATFHGRRPGPQSGAARTREGTVGRGTRGVSEGG